MWKDFALCSDEKQTLEMSACQNLLIAVNIPVSIYQLLVDNKVNVG